MNEKISNALLRYNYIESQIAEQYREIAAFFGLSESAFNILYALYLEGDGCQQSILYKNSGMSRKTAGSSFQKLQDDGILRIEKGPQRGNKVFLTEKGKGLLTERIAPIVEAENSEFASWNPEERDQFLKLGNRYLTDMAEKFRLLRQKAYI